MTTIHVDQVHFSYVPDEEVLHGISLTLTPGTVAIIGQNGAGKTTFVRLLNGLLKPTSGSVMVDDWNTKEYTVAKISRKVGLIFQNPNEQIFKSRVLDEVMFGPRNLGLSEREAKNRAEEALTKVGLLNAAAKHPYDLGLADRKLVSIASVLAMNPEVVIFDEPTIAQDHRGVEKIKKIIRDLQDDGKLVITITHDMDFVAETFARTIVFKQGTVALDGPTREVFSQPKVLEEAFVETPHITKLGNALHLPRTYLSVDEFVRDYQQRI